MEKTNVVFLLRLLRCGQRGTGHRRGTQPAEVIISALLGQTVSLKRIVTTAKTIDKTQSPDTIKV